MHKHKIILIQKCSYATSCEKVPLLSTLWCNAGPRRWPGSLEPATPSPPCGCCPASMTWPASCPPPAAAAARTGPALRGPPPPAGCLQGWWGIPNLTLTLPQTKHCNSAVAFPTESVPFPPHQRGTTDRVTGGNGLKTHLPPSSTARSLCPPFLGVRKIAQDREGALR